MQNPLVFEIVPDLGGGVHVRLRDAKNHEIIYWTENYRDRRDARRAIALAKRNAMKAPIRDLTRLPLRRAS